MLRLKEYIAAVVLVLLSFTDAHAGGIQTLDEVEVTDTQENLIGTADSANVGTVTKEQIESRPAYRIGELLEVTPGLIVTQHSGEGKANQYFLRGFNLDHGTDIKITVDDMPVNQPTHAHGQGYSDLNFVIPELVGSIQYKKGPYYASEGDFASVGAIYLNYGDTLPQRDNDNTSLSRGMAKQSFGQGGYWRTVVANSAKLGNGNILAAFEYMHNGKPQVKPDIWPLVKDRILYKYGRRLSQQRRPRHNHNTSAGRRC
ncbi:MAG: Plug domain-containing protein [Candidatus Magnetominusculus sp. LBB02]|nr:Plug domain-containing protein [Candidatus Magnetominusculus sp. LBB02]